jgi:hypothetical protein
VLLFDCLTDLLQRRSPCFLVLDFQNFFHTLDEDLIDFSLDPEFIHEFSTQEQEGL